MREEALVYVDLSGRSEFVGRLWSHRKNAEESATFEYDKEWLKNPAAFSLEPALILGQGKFQTRNKQRLFGALGDSAPDRWGRTLMKRAERLRSQKAKEIPRTLGELDFLLLVDDEARMGALRFKTDLDSDFVSHGRKTIPPLLDLGKLLSATEKVVSEDDEAEDIKLLLAPGSSLGGARPKASIREKDGTLSIAKFPNKQDDFDVVNWEALALTLAMKAGINVPKFRVELVEKRAVLILHRFDRIKKERLGFLSALSMLGALDNETHSYMEIADSLQQFGAERLIDSNELWKRILFNVLISNTDDHLRNHGFLYSGQKGWRLSPAYDLNPVPVEIRPRVLSTTIDEMDGTCSIDQVLKVSSYFNVKLSEARRTTKAVAEVVKNWRLEATKLKIKKNEVDQMESAFEHTDLKEALKM